jgi:hypothetical protein
MTGPSDLIRAQWRFSRLFTVFCAWAHAQGYEFRYGEAWRTPEQAKLNALRGTGIACSLHRDRLAVDGIFAKDGTDLVTYDAVRPLGEHWTTLDPDCRWGGNFTGTHGPARDIWHFSLAYGGRA